MKPENADTLLRDPDFPKLKHYIITVTGLSYFINKDEDLAHRLVRRLNVSGWTDCAGYMARLGSSSGAGSELDALVSELTIGETYFFRHSEQFDALRKLILPQILQKNEAKKTINIWCAGCSTGAEPYSISILLRREFKLQTQGWNIEILGTDINRAFLARAISGTFDAWHLRTVKDEIKTSCFTAVDRLFQINPEYQNGVSFAYHNLITGQYPPRLEGPMQFDIIFCRNVMIYFSHETIAGILPQFNRCLTPKGWLLLGYSEINTDLYKAFDLVPYPGAIMFQKKEENFGLPLPSQASLPPPLPSLPPLQRSPESPVATSFSPAPSAAPVAKKIDPQEIYRRCRFAADSGDFKTALRLTDEMLAQEQLDAKAHFFRGLVLIQMAEGEKGEESLRRAIYIDRNFAFAHYQLGLYYQKRVPKDAEKAKRYFNNARNLISRMRPLEILEEGGGMTAADLLQLLNMMGDAA